MSRTSQIALAGVALVAMIYSASVIVGLQQPSSSTTAIAQNAGGGGIGAGGMGNGGGVNAGGTGNGGGVGSSTSTPAANGAIAGPNGVTAPNGFNNGFNNGFSNSTTSTQVNQVGTTNNPATFAQTTTNSQNSRTTTTVTPNGTFTETRRAVNDVPSQTTSVLTSNGQLITTQTVPNTNNGLGFGGFGFGGYGYGGGYLQGGVSSGPSLSATQGVVTQGTNPAELGLYASSSQVSGHVFTGALGEQTTMYPADYLHRTGNLGPLTQQEAQTWNRMNNNRQVYGPMSLIRGSGAELQPTVVAAKDTLVDGIPQRVSGAIVMETADAPLISTNQFEMERSRYMASRGVNNTIASNGIVHRSAFTRSRSGWSRAEWKKHPLRWSDTHRF